MVKWKYGSKNVPGNLHQTAKFINDYFPHWDVVAMDSSGYNTVVVYREPLDEEPPKLEDNPLYARNLELERLVDVMFLALILERRHATGRNSALHPRSVEAIAKAEALGWKENV